MSRVVKKLSVISLSARSQEQEIEIEIEFGAIGRYQKIDFSKPVAL